MQPFVIIKCKIGCELLIGFLHTLKITEVHFFVLHRPPEPFDEDVVEHPATTIHADLDVLGEQ